jgi:hypothetical protein
LAKVHARTLSAASSIVGVDASHVAWLLATPHTCPSPPVSSLSVSPVVTIVAWIVHANLSTDSG